MGRHKELVVLFSSREDDAHKEIIVFCYEGLEGIYKDKEYQAYAGKKAYCKIKMEPRIFHKCYMTSVDTARLYYWSKQYGGHVLPVFWKEKDGIYRVEKDTCIDKMRSLAKKTYEQKNTLQKEDSKNLTEAISDTLAFLNDAYSVGKTKFTFYENGYVTNTDSSFDWSQNVFHFYYFKNSFVIEEKEIFEIYVSTSMERKVLENDIFSSFSDGVWTKEKLFSFISALDTYDTYVQISYIQGEEIKKEYIRFDGRKVTRCSDMFGFKDNLEILR